MSTDNKDCVVSGIHGIVPSNTFTKKKTNSGKESSLKYSCKSAKKCRGTTCFRFFTKCTEYNLCPSKRGSKNVMQCDGFNICMRRKNKSYYVSQSALCTNNKFFDASSQTCHSKYLCK